MMGHRIKTWFSRLLRRWVREAALDALVAEAQADGEYD